jgi:hypothetical protein
MKRTTIAIGTRNLVPDEFATRMQASIKAILSDAVTFPDGVDAVTESEETLDVLTGSIERLRFLEAEIAAVRAQRDEALEKSVHAYTSLSFYVQARARGNVEVIVRAAFRPARERTRRMVDPMPRVESVRWQATEDSGRAQAAWPPVARAKFYEIEITKNLNTEPWKHLTVEATPFVVVDGLVSGQRYWIRVRAGNGRGRGPWSNPVSAMIG